MALKVNSVPLADTIMLGLPRRAMRHVAAGPAGTLRRVVRLCDAPVLLTIGRAGRVSA